MDQVYNLKVHNAVLWKKLEGKGMRGRRVSENLKKSSVMIVFFDSMKPSDRIDCFNWFILA